MSFVLPGNNRQLRFTGEALAPAKDEPTGGPVALGKPRVRKPTTPPPQIPQPTARPQRNPTHQSYTPASPSGRSNQSYPPASIRQKPPQDDYEDGQATMALDREGHDVMPGGFNNAPIPRHSSRASTGPTGPAIPGFRPANVAAATAVVVPNQQQDRPKGAPLALWIVAAVLAGILSYHVTPAVMSHFEEPAPAKAGG